MLKGKLYCKNNNQCYFATARLIDELSNKCNLNVIVKSFENDESINVVVDSNEKILYSTQNPLKLIDFFKGYELGIEMANINNN